MELKFYTIGYQTEEWNCIIELNSYSEYSQEQFNEIVSQVLAEITLKRPDYEDDMENLLKESIDVLVKDYGFELCKSKIQGDFIIDGWSSFRTPAKNSCEKINLIREKYNLLKNGNP